MRGVADSDMERLECYRGRRFCVLVEMALRRWVVERKRGRSSEKERERGRKNNINNRVRALDTKGA